jgi:hypothetical protein
MNALTFAIIAVTLIFFLGLSGKYLLDPDLRQTAFNYVLWAFGALLIFSSCKSLYLGEMTTFTASEGEIKILMDKNPWRFWGSWLFKMTLGSFILSFLYNRRKQKKP